MTLSTFFDNIMHDLVIDTKKKIKYYKDVIVNNNVNKVIIFQLLVKKVLLWKKIILEL